MLLPPYTPITCSSCSRGIQEAGARVRLHLHCPMVCVGLHLDVHRPFGESVHLLLAVALYRRNAQLQNRVSRITQVCNCTCPCNLPAFFAFHLLNQREHWEPCRTYHCLKLCATFHCWEGKYTDFGCLVHCQGIAIQHRLG